MATIVQITMLVSGKITFKHLSPINYSFIINIIIIIHLDGKENLIIHYMN